MAGWVLFFFLSRFLSFFVFGCANFRRRADPLRYLPPMSLIGYFFGPVYVFFSPISPLTWSLLSSPTFLVDPLPFLSLTLVCPNVLNLPSFVNPSFFPHSFAFVSLFSSLFISSRWPSSLKRFPPSPLYLKADPRGPSFTQGSFFATPPKPPQNSTLISLSPFSLPPSSRTHRLIWYAFLDIVDLCGVDLRFRQRLTKKWPPPLWHAFWWGGELEFHPTLGRGAHILAVTVPGFCFLILCPLRILRQTPPGLFHTTSLTSISFFSLDGPYLICQALFLSNNRAIFLWLGPDIVLCL